VFWAQHAAPLHDARYTPYLKLATLYDITHVAPCAHMTHAASQLSELRERAGAEARPYLLHVFGCSAYPCPFEGLRASPRLRSTSAEFLLPNPMQLHSAYSRLLRRPASRT
jgi:hypothetical protein